MWSKFEEAHGDGGLHDHRHGRDADPFRRQDVVRFASAVATMEASPALLVSIETADGETLEHMKGVVASHLDGFAFREAPLPFNWSAREG
jgi:hypothetical protein